MSQKRKQKKGSSSANKKSMKGRILQNRSSFNIDHAFNIAFQYHQNGHLDKAEEIYNKILTINPNHADALHLLGIISHQVGKYDISVNLIRKAIQINPQNAIYYNSMGNVLNTQGKLEEVVACFRKAIEIKPDYADAYNNMGNALRAQGRTEEAIACFQKALAIKPGNAIVYYNMGNALNIQGKAEEAISCFRKAIEIKPDYTEVLNNMGVALNNRNRLDEAIACFQKAIAIKSDYVEAHNNMGNALKDQGELDKAVDYFRKALEIKPDYAQAYYNMGNILNTQGKTDEAIACFRKAIKIKPDYAEAYNKLGLALERQDKIEEAITFYRKALEIKPSLDEAYNHLALQLQHTCAWEKFEDLTGKFDETSSLGIGRRETPFFSVTKDADPSRNLAMAKLCNNDITRHISSLKVRFSFDDRISDKTKITVGYLSNDYNNHPTAHLMLSLFKLHSRDEFEVFCYSYGRNDKSYYRKQIEQDCDKFVDIVNLSDVDAAKCIYDDRVDILVELKGYTADNRLSICGLRPSPVQVSYLGFPGTTGADFIDYIITDRIVTPEDQAPYYTENFVYLPHCYQINDNIQPISNREWKRTDFGLPEGGFVFCSINQLYKVEPVMFDLWMNILRQVPESVLWLMSGNEIAEKNLRREAEARGIKPERLIFLGKLLKDKHLARLRLADLALDTRIVNGHTTTSDALWAGVPVITLEGNHFASRVSTSVLTAVGLPDLITHSLEEYESLAVRLAFNSSELQVIQDRLAKNRLTEPLFDTSRFTVNLEKAYREIWSIYASGKNPRMIHVEEEPFT